jgi:hypothetical protein
MAPHHVSLRRFCPSPVGLLTVSPGEPYLSMNPTQAQRTVSSLSKLRYCFYPWERLTVERAQTVLD